GAGEAGAHLAAGALHRQQQADRQRDGENRERHGETAVDEAGQGQAKQGHGQLFLAGAARFSSLSDRARSNSPARLWSWLTNSRLAPALRHSAKSRRRNASRLSASSAEVGSSAMTSAGWPISARAAATRCC